MKECIYTHPAKGPLHVWLLGNQRFIVIIWVILDWVFLLVLGDLQKAACNVSKWS